MTMAVDAVKAGCGADAGQPRGSGDSDLDKPLVLSLSTFLFFRYGT